MLQHRLSHNVDVQCADGVLDGLASVELDLHVATHKTEIHTATQRQSHRAAADLGVGNTFVCVHCPLWFMVAYRRRRDGERAGQDQQRCRHRLVDGQVQPLSQLVLVPSLAGPQSTYNQHTPRDNVSERAYHGARVHSIAHGRRHRYADQTHGSD